MAHACDIVISHAMPPQDANPAEPEKIKACRLDSAHCN